LIFEFYCVSVASIGKSTKLQIPENALRQCVESRVRSERKLSECKTALQKTIEAIEQKEKELEKAEAKRRVADRQRSLFPKESLSESEEAKSETSSESNESENGHTPEPDETPDSPKPLPGGKKTGGNGKKPKPIPTDSPGLFGQDDSAPPNGQEKNEKDKHQDVEEDTQRKKDVAKLKDNTKARKRSDKALKQIENRIRKKKAALECDVNKAKKVVETVLHQKEELEQKAELLGHCTDKSEAQKIADEMQEIAKKLERGIKQRRNIDESIQQLEKKLQESILEGKKQCKEKEHEINQELQDIASIERRRKEERERIETVKREQYQERQRIETVRRRIVILESKELEGRRQ